MPEYFQHVVIFELTIMGALLITSIALLVNQRRKATRLIRLLRSSGINCIVQDCDDCKYRLAVSILVGRYFLGWKQGKHYEV